jgi:hypothetical protein
MTQICTLTARRVKPGQMEALRDAFMSAVDNEPSDIVGRWQPVYVCRDVADENVLLTFGFFQGDLEELRQAQAATGGPPEHVKDYVDEVLFDGSFEVVEILNQEGAPT